MNNAGKNRFQISTIARKKGMGLSFADHVDDLLGIFLRLGERGISGLWSIDHRLFQTRYRFGAVVALRPFDRKTCQDCTEGFDDLPSARLL